MNVITNPVPSMAFDCIAWEFSQESEENKQIVDELLFKKGKSAHFVGMLIFYGYIQRNNGDKRDGTTTTE